MRGWVSRRRARAVSHAIDQQLKKDAQAARADKASRILLLGSGDSGKTTVLKQMKILHGGGFSAAERDRYRHIIAANILDSMRALIDALEALGLELANSDLEVRLVAPPPPPVRWGTRRGGDCFASNELRFALFCRGSHY